VGGAQAGGDTGGGPAAGYTGGGPAGGDTGGGGITLAGLEARIVVLASKTRPKRLLMRGSDGADYPYLLKGKDDLRLVRLFVFSFFL
jgi:hypothetical protein